jgi:hypothetical protein
MIAFALVQAKKELSRGTSGVYSLLEVPLRVLVLALAPQQQALAGAAATGTYLAVAGASCAGFLAGNHLRQYVDSRAILRIMLCLTILSGSMLVGAWESPRLVGLPYGLYLLALAAALLLARHRGLQQV